MSDSPLEQQFHEDMLRLATECKKLGYHASRFAAMVRQMRGRAVAQQLLRPGPPHDGFAEMLLRGRLDLTVEHVALLPEYRDLFTASELAVATERIGQRG